MVGKPWKSCGVGTRFAAVNPLSSGGIMFAYDPAGTLTIGVRAVGIPRLGWIAVDFADVLQGNLEFRSDGHPIVREKKRERGRDTSA